MSASNPTLGRSVRSASLPSVAVCCDIRVGGWFTPGGPGEAEDAFGVAVQEQVCGLVIEAEAGQVVQAVGRWPGRVAGPEQHLTPITAYSTANFAIKGFSEALIEDLRSNAPQVRVVLAMPGVVSTDIAENSRRALGLPALEQLSDAELLEQIPEVGRAILIATGLLTEDFTADELRRAIPRLKDLFQDSGFTAAQAAAIILDGVRYGAWRILVGEEAKMLDEQVRANPQAPFNYDNYAEMYGPLIAQAQAEASRAPEPT